MTRVALPADPDLLPPAELADILVRFNRPFLVTVPTLEVREQPAGTSRAWGEGWQWVDVGLGLQSWEQEAVDGDRAWCIVVGRRCFITMHAVKDYLSPDWWRAAYRLAADQRWEAADPTGWAVELDRRRRMRRWTGKREVTR